MDAVVQFIRNALCCIKDLNWFPNSLMNKPDQLFTLEPFNKTTPLEACIAVTQLYAFFSVSRAGFYLMTEDGLIKLRSINKVVEKRYTAGSGTADQLLDDRLRKEQASARRNIFIGINVFSIGVAFFWLFAHSFHVTETNWIGGIQGLIHALTVMEIGLAPLLYYMLSDAVTLIGRASVMEYLASILRKCKDKVPEVILTDETFAFLLHKGWTPFWAGKSGFEDEEKELDKEISSLISELESWTKDKDNKSMKFTIQATASRLEADAFTTRYQGYREVVYFFLNFFAFYGYFLGVYVYYRNKGAESFYSRALKLGLADEDADWGGNFAGDLMWTIGKQMITPRTEMETIILSSLYFSLEPERTHCYPSESGDAELVKAGSPQGEDRIITKAMREFLLFIKANRP
jgi:hypothetical protein